MIHVSMDRSQRHALAWASESCLPWFTVLPENVEASGLNEFKSTEYVPEYAVIDAAGNRLATDDDAFKKLEQLGADLKKQ